MEAQSVLTYNIAVRILLYLAQTWNIYLKETNQNRYSSTKMFVPKPELYVVFTGTGKERPEWISLADEFFLPLPCPKESEIKKRTDNVYELIVKEPSISRAEISRRLQLSDKQAKLVKEIATRNNTLNTENSNIPHSMVTDLPYSNNQTKPNSFFIG